MSTIKSYCIRLIFIVVTIITASNTKGQVINTGDQVLFVINNYNGPDKFKLFADQAITRLNLIVNSKEFKDSVVNHTYDWTNMPANCTYSGTIEDRTEIFNKLFSNRVVKISLNINSNFFQNLWKHYWPWSGEEGVDNANIPNTVITNQWFLNKHKQQVVSFYAGNIAHEYCHIMGFCHAGKDYKGRINTVPYAVGEIIKKISLKNH